MATLLRHISDVDGVDVSGMDHCFTSRVMAYEYRASDFDRDGPPFGSFFTACKIIYEQGYGHILGLWQLCCAQSKMSSDWLSIYVTVGSLVREDTM